MLVLQENKNYNDPRFRSGRRSKKQKEEIQSDKFPSWEEWNNRVSESSVYDRTVRHDNGECRQYGCHCTTVQESKALAEKRKKEEKEKSRLRYRLSDKQAQRVERYQQEKRSIDDLKWGDDL
jgi:hypothetical protein